MTGPNVYVDSFLTKKPAEGIQIVQTRLKDSMAFDIEIAEYFKERAHIEEEYAKNLSKASKRLYTMDSMILGYFAPVWEALVKELGQVSKYHSDMAHKITQDVENPLRTSPSDDYHTLQQLEPIILSMEKSKFSSVKGSIIRKSKQPSWKTEGPEYLSLHQKIDEARLHRLKQSVEEFEKIQSQGLMNRVNMATRNLSIAQSFDVQHDVQDFCIERGKGLTTVSPAIKNNSNKSLNTPVSAPHTREISSSNDSHRSPNKFTSLFMKKKKSFDQEDKQQPSHYAQMSDVTTVSTSPEASQAITPPSPNHAPLVDSEGYSIPAYSNHPNTASDISSRNTSDDVDSDFQSFKMNQKLKINIKDDVVQEESTEATESFNKMATMLRERTPTISRRPRGRRESAMLRSQTDSTTFGGTSPSQSQAMILNTTELNHSNPFMNSRPEHLPFTGVQPSDAPVHLQSIPEATPVTPSSSSASITISIVEKTSLTSPSRNTLDVKGEIFVHYHGAPTQDPVPLRLHHIDGIQQLTANPDYIVSHADGLYALDTTRCSGPVVCFTYGFSTSTLALPIRLTPSWKCVESVTYLMIKHEKSAMVQQAEGAVQVVIHGNHVAQVQSTPQGLWDVTKQQLTWKLQDVFNQYATEQEQLRLLAKFYVEGQGTPQPVYLNYIVKDSLVSGIAVTCDGVDVEQTETMVQSDQIVYS